MKKKLIVASAVAALGAASAVPAMAFENSFNGMYKLKYFLSNYENGGSNQIGSTGVSSPANAFKPGATAANYFEQRARIFYTAKAADELKLVTGFEIDSVFGDKSQGGIASSSTASNFNATAFRNSGGALDSDAVNLETKWVYLDFMVPSTPLNIKAGIQPYKDAFKGIFLDADIAGVYASAKYGNAQTAVGYFRPYEALVISTGSALAPRGTDNFDVGVLEGKYNISKDLSVGAAYYLYADYRTSPVTFHTFGVNAEGKFGPATISGFAAYQGGFSKVNTNGLTAGKGHTVSAFAANVAGKVKAGPGAAKLAFLYTSGDQDQTDGVDHSWQSISQSSYGTAAAAKAAQPNASSSTNSYNESGMMLLNRNAAQGGTSTDTNLIYNTNNNGQGAIIVAAGYDAAITPKFYANFNAGAGFNAENIKTATATPKNGSHYLGTEINGEVGYKLYDNLTASVQAAYLFLGTNFDKVLTGSKDPVDPYTARVVLSYVF